jgi:hypothetical protein
MIDGLPIYLTSVFILCTLFVGWMFYKASDNNNRFLLLSVVWLGAVTALALFEFFSNTGTTPPRMPLLIAPMLVVMVILFYSKKGKSFIDGLNLKTLTWLHIVRIPVEIGIFWLFTSSLVPQLMTFEGRNFDIIAGITAPIVAYLYFNKKSIGKKALLIWNVVCLVLLLNIVIHAILSVPSPFQQFAFNQPNVGILYFPFVYLPSYIVPVVLFSHLVAIRRLTGGER